MTAPAPSPNRVFCDPLAVKVGEAAKLLGISRATLSRRIAEGKLKKNSYGRLSMKQLQKQAEDMPILTHLREEAR